MDMEHAVAIIETQGYYHWHGDHYSFNSQEFVAWCAQVGEPAVSLEQVNHDLAPFCQRIGYSEPVRAWRYYLT